MTASLGYVEPDDIGTTLATIMMNIINDAVSYTHLDVYKRQGIMRLLLVNAGGELLRWRA